VIVPLSNYGAATLKLHFDVQLRRLHFREWHFASKSDVRSYVRNWASRRVLYFIVLERRTTRFEGD